MSGMTTYLAYGVPEADSMQMPASKLRWGRIIGRTNLGLLQRTLREMGKTIVLVSDSTGQTVEFRWNGIKTPFVRGAGQNPPSYGEWLSVSSDEKLRKLKIHIDGLGYQHNTP